MAPVGEPVQSAAHGANLRWAGGFGAGFNVTAPETVGHLCQPVDTADDGSSETVVEKDRETDETETEQDEDRPGAVDTPFE